MPTLEQMKKEAHEEECADEKVKCEYCSDTGEIEIMGGTDYDDWTVVATKRCVCQD